jgi:Mor family transcriptional regulator
MKNQDTTSNTETSATSILVSLVGREGAEKFLREFGGEAKYWPRKIKDGRDDIIKAQFHEMLSTGGTCMSSYKQLAKRHELSPRRIMAIVNC